MRNIVIFDYDGTLSNGAHRLHMLPTKDQHLTETWLEFNQAAKGDSPFQDTIDVLNGLYRAGYFIIILTGRSRAVEADARDWLERHGVNYNLLKMREADDNRKDTVIKEEFIRDVVGIERIVCCYDDSPSVIAHFRSMGLTVYQVCDYGDNLHHRTDLHSHGVDKL